MNLTRNPRRTAVALVAAAVALFAAGCQSQRNGQDVYTFYNSGVPYSQQINHSDIVDGPERDGYEHIWQDINETCVDTLNEDEDEGTVGSWGTVGSSTNATQANDSNSATIEHVYLTSLGTVPSEDTVNCFMDEVLDDPNDENDNESVVCDDAFTDADCQDPDASTNYVLLSDETDFYQNLLAGDGSGGRSYADAEHTIVLIRDYMSETIQDPNGGSPGAVGCLFGRLDSPWHTERPDDGHLEWRRVCIG